MRIKVKIDHFENAKDFRHQDYRKELDKREFWRGVKTTLFILFFLFAGAFFIGAFMGVIS